MAAAPGAFYDSARGGVFFGLFSAHAQKVELCLFDDRGNETRHALAKGKDDIWGIFVPGLKPGQRYGYRVHGPYDPANGMRFNPHKLLIDPYARELDTQDFDRSRPEHLGYSVNPYEARHIDRRDNAAWMAKSVVTAELPAMNGRPGTADGKTIIYEAHVRGFSRLKPGVPQGLRGTYAGLGHAASVSYLKDLGVTAVELLPVHSSFTELALQKRGQENYWGYNTLNFFTPEAGYAAGKDVNAEFRTMADSLHKAGIELILDVVYNHTAEGDEWGPTFSFRGIDNASYYLLNPHDRAKYLNATGCGNTVNINNPPVTRLVCDSLRHWARAMGADGFRFDLALVHGRTPQDPHDFDANAPFFKAIAADPALNRLKMIAEGWDATALFGHGRQGRPGFFPARWAEWNNMFRDTMRSFLRGDGGLSDFAAAMAGSSLQFDHAGKNQGPARSLNFITAHDGFTLRDLVSYSRKHNHANGEDNRDGSDDNRSANYGAEGETADPVINATRLAQMKNMLAALLLAQGTPMLLAGDEFGHTQHGNNNPYCLEISLDWARLATPEGKALHETAKALIALRKENPALASETFLHARARDAHGVADLTWWHPSGREMTGHDWHEPGARVLGIVFNNAACAAKAPSRLLAVFNAGTHPAAFSLPALPGGGKWEPALPGTPAPGRALAGRSFAVYRQAVAPAA